MTWNGSVAPSRPRTAARMSSRAGSIGCSSPFRKSRRKWSTCSCTSGRGGSPISQPRESASPVWVCTKSRGWTRSSRASARSPRPGRRESPAAPSEARKARREGAPRPAWSGGVIGEPFLSWSVEQRVHRGPGHGAHLAPGFPPVPERDQRRNAADAEARRGGGVAVGVELEDQRLALAVAGHVVEHRGHHLARTAPVGVEIHQHRHLGAPDGLVEVGVGGRHRAVKQQRALAFRALRAVREAPEVHPVELPAERTADGGAAAGVRHRQGVLQWRRQAKRGARSGEPLALIEVPVKDASSPGDPMRSTLILATVTAALAACTPRSADPAATAAALDSAYATFSEAYR